MDRTEKLILAATLLWVIACTVPGIRADRAKWRAEAGLEQRLGRIEAKLK